MSHGPRWSLRPRTGLQLVGLPAALTTLAHLNIHAASGVPFAAPRLVLPGVLGLVTGFFLVRELARKAEQARLMDSLAEAVAVRTPDPLPRVLVVLDARGRRVRLEAVEG